MHLEECGPAEHSPVAALALDSLDMHAESLSLSICCSGYEVAACSVTVADMGILGFDSEGSVRYWHAASSISLADYLLASLVSACSSNRN